MFHLQLYQLQIMQNSWSNEKHVLKEQFTGITINQN